MLDRVCADSSCTAIPADRGHSMCLTWEDLGGPGCSGLWCSNETSWALVRLAHLQDTLQ